MARGTHGRQGPPPDPNALRRSRTGDREWVTLPAEGRTGSAPKWPLPVRMDGSDGDEDRVTLAWMKAHWKTLWKLPQAIMWERLHLTEQVALYLVTFRDSMKPDAPASTRTVVLRMEEELGISASGMARHRWRIATDEVAAARDQYTAAAPSATAKNSAGARLKAIN